MYSLCHEVCCLSYNTRSTCCDIKHNDPYRPLSSLWWWKILAVKCKCWKANVSAQEKSFVVSPIIVSAAWHFVMYWLWYFFLHWEGHGFTCIILMFLLTWLHCSISFLNVGRGFLPQGLAWYNFPAALDVILINMLKAQHLKINIFPSLNS